jgi:hypothetical protein
MCLSSWPSSLSIYCIDQKQLPSVRHHASLTAPYPSPRACHPRSIKTKAPITAMHIHNGTLNPDAQGPVGVQLYPSNATLTTYTPDDTLTVYVPVDAAALAKDVYPDMAAFIKVGDCLPA